MQITQGTWILNNKEIILSKHPYREGIFLSLKETRLTYGNKKNNLDTSIRGKRQIQSLDISELMK